MRVWRWQFVLFAVAVVLSLLVALAAIRTHYSAKAIDPWYSWRGADRSGHSRETGLLNQWPEGGPRLLWQVSGLGQGYSTPAVTESEILLMGNQDGQEWVRALDPNRRGEPLWSAWIGPVRHQGDGYPGPRSTPTVDGQRVYALGLNGDLLCLNLRDGQSHWRVNLASDLGGVTPNWGYAESVLIDGPWVVCTPGGPHSTMIALDKLTGQLIWRAAIGDGAAYASIVKAEIAGVPQYVQFTAAGVIGVRAADGKLLWRYDAPSSPANCATVVVNGDMVFAASGYGIGGGLVRVVARGDQMTAEEVYFTKKMKNHHGGLILIGKHLYGANDPGLLTCLEFETGEQAWADRSCGKCSLLYVDGKLIVRSEEGQISLVEATPQAFRLKGRFDQPNRSDQASWPHPVVVNGRLYLRDQDQLFCFDVRGDAPKD